MSSFMKTLQLPALILIVAGASLASAQDAGPKKETPPKQDAETPKNSPDQATPPPAKPEWGYLGTPVSEWIRVYGETKDNRTKLLAMKAFAELGKNAPKSAPILLEVARNPRSYIIKGKPKSRNSLKAAHAYALQGLGKLGVESYRQLLTDINSDKFMVRSGALDCLSLIKPVHPDSVTAVTKLLFSKTAITRSKSSDVLSKMGAPAVAALTEVLSSDDKVARTYACSSLGRIGKEASSAIPKIAEQLDPKEQSLCVAAASAISKFGEDGAFVIDKLIKVFKTDNRLIKNACLRCFVAFGPKAEPAVPAVIEYFKTDKPNRRLPAIRAVGKIGPAAAAAVPMLIDALEYRRYPQILKDSCIALTNIGPKSAPATPKLLALFIDAKLSPTVRIEAGRALARIGLKNDAIVAGVKAVFDNRDDDPDVRVMSARVFGDIDAVEMKDELVKALAIEDDTVIIIAIKRSLRKLFRKDKKPAKKTPKSQ